MAEIDAVIFDMDGTLINSIPIFLVAYEKVLEKDLGLTPEESVIRKQFGKSSRDIISSVLDELKVDPQSVDVDAVLADVRKEFADHIKEVIVLPGVFDLLEKLEGEYPLGLATSSRKYYADRILHNFDLKDYFETVVTADDVMRAKPAPDIFLKTAERLDTEPQRCLVFEDAVHGVMAAKSAGMKTIGVATGSSTREELEGVPADAVIKTLKDFDVRILK